MTKQQKDLSNEANGAEALNTLITGMARSKEYLEAGTRRQLCMIGDECCISYRMCCCLVKNMFTVSTKFTSIAYIQLGTRNKKTNAMAKRVT